MGAKRRVELVPPTPEGFRNMRLMMEQSIASHQRLIDESDRLLERIDEKDAIHFRLSFEDQQLVKEALRSLGETRSESIRKLAESTDEITRYLGDRK